MRCLVVVRHPLEVARSLAARNHFAIEKGLLLWLRHALDVEQNTADHLGPSSLTAIFCGTGRLHSRRYLKHFEYSGPSTPGLIAVEAEDFLSDEFRHHSVAGVTAKELKAPLAEAWQAMVDPRVGRHPGAPALFQGLRRELDRVAPLYQPLLDGLERDLTAHKDQAARLERDLTAHKDQAARLERDLTAHKDQAARLERDLTAHKDQTARLRAALEARSKEAAERADEIVGVRARLHESSQRNATLEHKLAAIRRSLVWIAAKPAWKLERWLRGGTLRHISRHRKPKYYDNVPAQKRMLSSRRSLRDEELIAKSGLFDSDWYLAQNPDVARSGTDPISHFIRHGAAEGRAPKPQLAKSVQTALVDPATLPACWTWAPSLRQTWRSYAIYSTSTSGTSLSSRSPKFPIPSIST